jgi:hypothetical protein
MSETIVQLVAEKRPENVQQLVDFAESELSVPRNKIIECVMQLQDGGVITLKKPASASTSLLGYLGTSKASWYWMALTLSMATSIVAFVVPENAYPFGYARILLGLLFLLFLPGHSLVRAVFPRTKSVGKQADGMDDVEMIALSIGLSLAFVPMVVLLLNYTPWGITLTSIILSLLAFTVVCATIAVAREHGATMRAAT